MENVPFVKEAVKQSDQKVVLLVVNQKQFRHTLSTTIERVLENQSLVLVSLAMGAENALEKIPPKLLRDIVVIDSFSEETEKEKKLQNVIKVGDSINLTRIQIAIEEALEQISGEKTIIIDSLGVLATYNDAKVFGKFLHLFSNKVRIREHSCILIAVKDSFSEESMTIAENLCDKVLDYSKVYISELELAQQ